MRRGSTAADVVLEVSHPALSPYLPEAHQAVLAAAIRERGRPTSSCSRTPRPASISRPAAAAAAGLPFVGYCVGWRSRTARRESTSGIYGGQLEATVRTPLPAVFAVNTAALHEEPTAAGRGERVQLPPPAELESLRTTFVEPVMPPDEGVDLTKAERIVCVGRGIGGAENIPVAEELADALGAELGASRPVIDSGWLPKARQIGKSGATVRPKLYLSLGVSGAPEHVEGMQGAELIVAVNTDPGGGDLPRRPLRRGRRSVRRRRRADEPHRRVTRPARARPRRAPARSARSAPRPRSRHRPPWPRPSTSPGPSGS